MPPSSAGIPGALPRLRWAAVAAWMGVIFWLSSRSALPRPPGAPPDVVSVAGHLVVYAVLALLLAWALTAHGRPLLPTLAAAWLIAVLYGVTDEVHQSFVPNRYPDTVDVATDAAGAALALVALRWRLGRTRASGPETGHGARPGVGKPPSGCRGAGTRG